MQQIEIYLQGVRSIQPLLDDILLSHDRDDPEQKQHAGSNYVTPRHHLSLTTFTSMRRRFELSPSSMVDIQGGERTDQRRVQRRENSLRGSRGETSQAIALQLLRLQLGYPEVVYSPRSARFCPCFGSGAVPALAL